MKLTLNFTAAKLNPKKSLSSALNKSIAKGLFEENVTLFSVALLLPIVIMSP